MSLTLRQRLVEQLWSKGYALTWTEMDQLEQLIMDNKYLRALLGV